MELDELEKPKSESVVTPNGTTSQNGEAIVENETFTKLGKQNGEVAVENKTYAKLEPKQLNRLKAEEGVVTSSGGQDSRASSFSSIGSTSDLDHARRKARARARRRDQSRSDSLSSNTSASGMGGGGMVQYSQYSDVMHDHKVKGIGGHGSPSLPTKSSHYKDVTSLNVAF